MPLLALYVTIIEGKIPWNLLLESWSISPEFLDIQWHGTPVSGNPGQIGTSSVGIRGVTARARTHCTPRTYLVPRIRSATRHRVFPARTLSAEHQEGTEPGASLLSPLCFQVWKDIAHYPTPATSWLLLGSYCWIILILLCGLQI